jgi:MYXO-CTERM domain-containing protein
VIVDADPGASGWLDALMIDHQDVHSLQNTTPISVRTQDPQQYPWDDPVAEIIEDELPGGTPLLGSVDDFSTEPQLANEDIVTVDMLGNSFFDLYGGAPFDRYTDPMGEFHASHPSAQFNAQRAFQLTQAGRWYVDRVALGKWDSAVEWISMGAAVSAYAPGQYRPRFMIAYNHASTGATAAAFLAHPLSGVLLEPAFPEYYQRPAPGQQHECVSEVKLGPGTVPAHILFHELGHSYDFFLAPSIPKENVSPCVAGCDTTCDEDTSDEANPLTETIAQMFALWQLRAVFPDLPHGTCELFSSYLTAGGSLDQKHVHSPECMGMDDQINMFVRDDDPACSDSTLCDKPHDNETDPSLGDPNVCDSTSGYNTFSILQAWWNMLNGLYCEPTAPFTCNPAAPQWPPGCALPASPVACVTPAEASGLALVYALRTNPLSYEELFDAMARFVSCNYGGDAYEQFNQALCDHEIRPCDAVAPAMCETCGNGIREGGEECDGDDLSLPILGGVQTCVGLGYGGGTLACHDAASIMPCTYDTSACTPVGLDDTGSGTDSSGSSSESGSESGSDSGTSGPTGGGGDGAGGGSGCGCRSANETGGMAGFGLMMLLALRRVRRLRPVTWRSLALLAPLGLVGCADDCASDRTSSTATTTQATETAEASTTHGVTTGSTSAWPEAWFGDFHSDPGVPIGVPLRGCSGGWVENIRVGDGQLTVEGFTCRGDIVPGSGTTYETELTGDGLRVLPTEPSGEVVWIGGFSLATVVIRPGDACDELRAEFVGVSGPTFEARWLRGRLCLIDPYDETIANDTYLLDLCDGATTECSDP